MEIAIVGAGVGGLTLALSLHAAGIRARVYEAAAELRELGVGINLLPHATRELTELGLQRELAAVAVATREVVFCNRFGQTVLVEPRGRHAGYEWPQFSIHRADLQRVLLDAVRERLGPESVVLGRRCVAVQQDASGAMLRFEDGDGARADAVIGCDGVHSQVRRQLHPDEGPPSFQGINMWRGVTRMKPYLSGASMVMAGWLEVGKLVAYPIRNDIDGRGTQLVNWVAELQSPKHVLQDWSRAGRLEDFLPVFRDWRFDWLDVSGMLSRADLVLEYPMVDREPLPFWTQGRVTLLGDAAHPMYPRGSNGAGQAILDARVLAGCLRREGDVAAALRAYEAARLAPAYAVVLANRKDGPDAVLREVHRRTGDRPFVRIEDVATREELTAILENYRRIAGFAREGLATRASLG